MKDIIMDEGNDLLWKNGDIEWAESNFSNVVDLLDLAIGENKQYPYLGAYVQKYRNSPIDIQSVQRDIKLQLEADGWKLSSATATVDQEGQLNIKIDASRSQ